MPYRKDRSRATAYLEGSDNARARAKPVVLSTGRGDTKLTAAEARELAAELLRVAQESESRAEATEP